MKNQLITEIETAMLPFLDNAQLKQLHYALNHALWNKTITESESATFVQDDISNFDLMSMFISAKRVEGCSEKTLKYYKAVITRLLETLTQHITHITTDDLRQYLALHQQKNDCSKANIDNIKTVC